MIKKTGEGTFPLIPRPHTRHVTASARIFVLLLLRYIDFAMVLEQEQEMAIAPVASLRRDARPHGSAAPIYNRRKQNRLP